jgi:hypothetical protein
MLVIDETKGLGWFVTDRNQPEDKVCVYLFIPDEQRSRVEGNDLPAKRSRAIIASIAQTWIPGADYTDQIQLAHAQIPLEKESQHKDFEFVINNSLVYYVLSDIKSPEARTFYEKKADLHRQIDELSNKLEELRTTYAKGNDTRKAQLAPTILQAEEQLYSLSAQPAELEKKARNAEINFLKLNL